MTDKTPSPPPAYFLSLSLENVRSFGEKQTISFARPDGRPAQWTIILGDNGVGKTTVLKALAALTPIDDPHLKKELAFDMAFSTLYFEDWNYKWEPIREKSIDSELSCNIGIGMYLDIEAPLHSRPIRVEEKVSVEWAEGMPGKQGQGILGYNATGFCCFGYGAGRTVGNSTLSDASGDSDNYSSLFDDRADLLNPEEWFLRMEYSALKGEKRDGEILTQVVNVLLQVLPDVTNIRISSKGHQQYLELETPYGWVRLRDMSLGYQTLVVWLTDFASKLFIRYPDSPNPLEEPAIVLIDEIDLHLHPEWQRKLIGFLSGIFKNTQFIATAHSPLVVQAAGDEGANVVLLKRVGDQTIVQQNVEDVRGWRLDQILTSELFGLETARSPQTEEKMQRRAELLIKTKRTAAETKELEMLSKELNAGPLGETPSEREVNAVLQELRQRMQQKGSDAAAV